MSSHSTSAVNDRATTTRHENTVTAIADKIGRNDLTADDQAEVDFWTSALEEHSNRAMLNISRQALAKLLGIIGKLRTEQREPERSVSELPPELRARYEDHDPGEWSREYWTLDQAILGAIDEPRTDSFIADLITIRDRFRAARAPAPSDETASCKHGYVLPCGLCAIDRLVAGVQTGGEFNAPSSVGATGVPASMLVNNTSDRVEIPAAPSVEARYADALSEDEQSLIKRLREFGGDGWKTPQHEVRRLLSIIDRLSASGSVPSSELVLACNHCGRVPSIEVRLGELCAACGIGGFTVLRRMN
jgi:ribosomal protein L37E